MRAKKFILKKSIGCDACGKEIAVGKSAYSGMMWIACSPKCTAELHAEDCSEMEAFGESLDTMAEGRRSR